MRPPRRRVAFTGGSLQLFCVGVAVLYAAASQNNGAAYLLAFALFGLFCIGTVEGLRNLSGLTVRGIGMANGYALSEGDAATGFVNVRLSVHNGASGSRRALQVSLPGFFRARSGVSLEGLAPGAMEERAIRVDGLPRGYHAFPAAEVSSLYPFGFSRVTLRFPLQEWGCWIYPAPKGGDPMPVGDSATSGSGGGGSGGDDFVGVRNYQEGESQRHVDWKAVSRGNPRMVKQFGGGSDRAVLLDWDRLGGGVESRLSSLCFWLLEVEREGYRYALKLPGVETASGNGPEHLHAALRLLALYPGETSGVGKGGRR